MTEDYSPSPPPPPPPERRAKVNHAARAVNVYTISAVVLAGLTVTAVTLVAILRPEQTSMVTPTIIGVSTPIMTALLAAGLRGVATVADGQVGQIMLAVRQAEHAKGVVEGMKEAPRLLRDEP